MKILPKWYTFQVETGPFFNYYIHPFESHVIRQFYLMANNNSLELLSDIIPNAGELLEMAKIDLFGNGRNWSNAWLLLNKEQQLLLSAYVLTHKF